MKKNDVCPDCGGSGYVSDGRGSGEPCGCVPPADPPSQPPWVSAVRENITVVVRANRELTKEEAIDLACTYVRKMPRGYTFHLFDASFDEKPGRVQVSVYFYKGGKTGSQKFPNDKRLQK